ncbi:MAG: thioredoxin-like domain-containing protein, partial [Myxococcota bacterium]|nr:thioredoxin-like domain-containing protein [Myxococcota bacterium]
MNNISIRWSSVLVLLWLVSAGCGADEESPPSSPSPDVTSDGIASSDAQVTVEEPSVNSDVAQTGTEVSPEVTPDGKTDPEPEPDAGPSEPLTYPYADEGASQVIPAEAAFVAPELNGGLAWLNTPEPLRFDDQLKGHVVLLDFWTYGCVNCLHIIPVLQELEEMYADYPFIVIGIHSGKFATESEAQAISAAIQHYEIGHPVLVDDAYALWNAYNVKGWPTVGIIDAQGRIRFSTFGEFLPEKVIPPLDYLLQEAFESGVAAD